MLDLYVDADACPVKPEVYRVARRYQLAVTLVANAWLEVPLSKRIKLVLVDGQLDAADDWIAEHIAEDDIVVTADIPLASRCLKKGARALGPRGRVFDENSIGDALATRDLLAQLRESGTMVGGPRAFSKKDRSRFLQSLDAMIQAVRRGA